MKETPKVAVLGGSIAGLLLAACIPLFTDGTFQTLRLRFRVNDALADGEARPVHSAVFPNEAKVKKNFVQLSGRLTATDGEELPARLSVEAEIENADSGRLVQRITVDLAIAEDGSFMGNARLRKSISSGERMSVTLEPSGGELADGTEVTLCVDLVKKKGELGLLPDCLADDGGPDDPDDAVTFASLQAEHFTPTCSRSSCHSTASARAGLVLTQAEAYSNLVGVPSTQRPQFNRVSPGDPENSYMVKKLRGDADIEGERMPDGGPFLTEEQLARIIRWIEAGAPDN